MPISVLPYEPLLRRLEEVVAVVAQEHGRATLAEFMVKYEYLLTLLDIAAKDADNALSLDGLVYHLAHEIQRAYGAMESDAQLPPWCYHEGAEPRLRFDATIFAERYAARARSLKPDPIRLDDSTASELKELTPYIYVLDLTGSIIVWPQPLTSGQFALARDQLVDPDPVTHPMLAPDGLTVLCAGELALVKDIDNVVQTVVANTKSGHFRPPPQSVRYLRKAFMKRLALSSQSIIIFTAFSGDRPSDPFIVGTDKGPARISRTDGITPSSDGDCPGE